MEDLETWQSNGRVVIRKFDRSGNLEPVMVNRGKKIQLTEQERLLNQDRAASEAVDPFTNGTLVPVRILSDSESVQAIKENPNLLTEEDMLELLNSHYKTFEKRVSEIFSPYVIRRMVDLAQEGEVDVSSKRVAALKSRLAEVSNDVQVVEVERPLEK